MSNYKPFIEVEVLFYEPNGLEELNIDIEPDEKILKTTINKDFISEFYPDGKKGSDDNYTSVVIAGGHRLLVNMKYEQFKRLLIDEYQSVGLDKFRDRDLR